MLIALLSTSAILPGLTTALTVSADETQQVETTFSPKAAGDIASSNFGTSEWNIDSEGVLHIGGGSFKNTGGEGPWKAQAANIKKIAFEGTVLIGSDASGLFEDLVNVQTIEGIERIDTSKVTDMSNMFSNMKSLTSLDLSNFDTLKATNQSYMFNNMKSLSKLTLGTKVMLKDNAALPSLSISGKYSGKWINVGKGTVEVPKGVNIWSSQELMKSYDGSKHADTYVWQQDLTAVNVHDSILQVGDTWTAEDNFDSAMTSDGYDVKFKDVSVTGEVDTSQVGQYPVTYTYNGISETATVTVKEASPIQGEDITVKYQDESGKSIADSVSLKGKVGENYSSSKKTIKDYTFKEVKGNISGKFTDKAQTVIYVYKKNNTTPAPSKQEVVNVYRLYNKKTQEHLYTADKYEYEKLPTIAKDWVREGVNFKGYKASSSTTVAVRRVYNPKSGEHLTTTDANEVKVLKSKGWKDEGISFYAPKTGGNPIYRLFNAKAGLGAHFVTADAYEKKVLTTAPKEWKYEGIAWRSVK